MDDVVAVEPQTIDNPSVYTLVDQQDHAACIIRRRPRMAVFEFRDGKVSRIREYWNY